MWYIYAIRKKEMVEAMGYLASDGGIDTRRQFDAEEEDGVCALRGIQ